MDPYGIRLHQLGFPWQPMGISLNLSYLLRWGRGFCESLFHLPKSKVRQATQLTAKLFVQFFCADIFYIYDISILLTIDTIKWCKYIKNDLLLQADLISLKSNSQQTTIKEPTPNWLFQRSFRISFSIFSVLSSSLSRASLANCMTSNLKQHKGTKRIVDELYPLGN